MTRVSPLGAHLRTLWPVATHRWLGAIVIVLLFIVLVPSGRIIACVSQFGIERQTLVNFLFIARMTVQLI